MDLRNITKITRNMTLYKNTINRGKEYLNDTEFEMVRYVTKHEERSLVEVANYLNVDKGLVTRMYKKLVGLGYLEVKSDENDSRKKISVATPKAKELPKEITYPTDKLSLEVNNLTFGFDQSFVLHNISFHLNKGETLGVCGMIHSGKSTLEAALSGLYDYDGSIKLQGVELKEARNDLANNFISYAPSQTEIFNDTIRYNIAFEDAKVHKEIHMSYLNEDINSFENKEDELLSHSIANLSGGQQKRLQISRGLYNSPKLIVMDDPFNAIDLEMSKKITDNIIKEYKESIFVLINNQKEILQKMDYIIFLKHDSYIYGTYEEMMKDLDFLKLIGGKQNECN